MIFKDDLILKKLIPIAPGQEMMAEGGKICVFFVVVYFVLCKFSTCAHIINYAPTPKILLTEHLRTWRK